MPVPAATTAPSTIAPTPVEHTVRPIAVPTAELAIFTLHSLKVFRPYPIAIGKAYFMAY